MRELHVPQECPLEVSQLVQACMAEDPSQRPTARELVQLLSEMQELEGGY